MENKRKLPPKSKEVARALAAFIVEHWHYCPVHESVPVDGCEGWQSVPAACLECVKRHAGELK